MLHLHPCYTMRYPEATTPFENQIQTFEKTNTPKLICRSPQKWAFWRRKRQHIVIKSVKFSVWSPILGEYAAEMRNFALRSLKCWWIIESGPYIILAHRMLPTVGDSIPKADGMKRQQEGSASVRLVECKYRRWLASLRLKGCRETSGSIGTAAGVIIAASTSFIFPEKWMRCCRRMHA